VVESGFEYESTPPGPAKSSESHIYSKIFELLNEGHSGTKVVIETGCNPAVVQEAIREFKEMKNNEIKELCDRDEELRLEMKDLQRRIEVLRRARKILRDIETEPNWAWFVKEALLRLSYKEILEIIESLPHDKQDEIGDARLEVLRKEAEST